MVYYFIMYVEELQLLSFQYQVSTKKPHIHVAVDFLSLKDSFVELGKMFSISFW